MPQCLIYEKSLRFSRTTYGILSLIAFLIQNRWLVLATSLLMILGAFSVKLNIPYQLHVLILREMLKEKLEPIQKEPGELSFACGMGGGFLLIGFLFLGKYPDFAWILILTTSLLMFLAGSTGFCMASLIYAFFKEFFKKRK